MSKQLKTSAFVCNHRFMIFKNTASPIHFIGYDSDHYHDQLYDEYEIHRPTDLSKWVPQRQAQFLVGRLAAKKALTSHKVSPLDTQIGIGDHREPIWPSGYIGSISHSGQISIACVEQRQTARSSIGIDLQNNIDEAMQEKISSTILTDKDHFTVKKGVANLSESQLFTLIFSAKESVFKALFDDVGEYFDFKAVSVEKIDCSSQQITLKTTTQLSEDIPKGTEIRTTFVEMNTITPQIITMCHWNYSV